MERSVELTSLGRVAKELSAADEVFVAWLAEIEKDLQALELGITVAGCIVIDDPPREGSGEKVTEHRLALDWHEDAWRILVRRHMLNEDADYDSDDVNQWPLVECHRGFRIKAMRSGALDELIRKLLCEAEAQLRDLHSLSPRLLNFGERANRETTGPRVDDSFTDHGSACSLGEESEEP